MEINKFLIRMKDGQNPSCEYDLKKYYPAIHQKIHEKLRSLSLNMVMDNLKKGKKEGLYRSEINVEIIARLHVTRMELLTLEDFIRGTAYTNSDVLTEVLFIISAALPAKKELII